MSVSAGAVVDAVVRDVSPSGGIHDVATIAPTEVNSRTLSDRGLSWHPMKPILLETRFGCHDWLPEICAAGILAKWFSMTRLETRTKESNTYASSRVENPDAQ